VRRVVQVCPRQETGQSKRGNELPSKPGNQSESIPKDALSKVSTICRGVQIANCSLYAGSHSVSESTRSIEKAGEIPSFRPSEDSDGAWFRVLSAEDRWMSVQQQQSIRPPLPRMRKPATSMRPSEATRRNVEMKQRCPKIVFYKHLRRFSVRRRALRAVTTWTNLPSENFAPKPLRPPHVGDAYAQLGSWASDWAISYKRSKTTYQ
jgi:hypothetical protein